ncbi:hypothetical protein HIM_02858 [Hirsutella minnesotensis 3608]|nr:hypothetical protein HIM_02858 [Hirsutella minnesotensis 3608]
MPAALPSKEAPRKFDSLDNYDVDDDDPFASPSPPPASSKKRTEADAGLGIDEEVTVQKRARVPNIKLDEHRLLDAAGIPKLRARAARSLRFKGKGHEFSDAQRLLSFYQLWLDDLFPKARFLDALAMVEKAGHKKIVMAERENWINEGRPKHGADEDDQGGDAESAPAQDGDATTAAEDGAAQQTRPQTPTPADDVPDEDDLYDATPRPPARIANPLDDEDDLDALIGEAEQVDGISRPPPKPQPARAHHEDDDLDALIAEAETLDRDAGRITASAPTEPATADFEDEEAALAEMEGS